jgi:hypothetical protein
MKFFRTISSLLLIILMLVSSTSFVVGMHICMGSVQNVSLFTKAEACAMEKKLPPCHRQTQKPCCADETLVHQASDFKASLDQLQIEAPTPLCIVQPLVVLSEIIPSAPVSRTLYHNYDPPLRSCDLTVALQVFLI